MKYPRPLKKGKILKRYKRFFVDVELPNKTIEVCHLPNTGPILKVLQKGRTCYIMEKENPKKMKYGLEIIQVHKTLVGINTQLPNRLFLEALRSGKIKKKYKEILREVKVGQSKIDFLLKGEKDHYIEIKNCSGVDDEGVAFFPDTVSERALKHVKELTELKKKELDASLVFIVQRNDIEAFRPGDEYHPEYGKALREAKLAGVNLEAYACTISLTGIEIARKIKIIL